LAAADLSSTVPQVRARPLGANLGREAAGVPSYREAKGGAFDSFHHKRPAHASQTSNRTCATIFPDLSQPRCANPNQGHPGRAKPIPINSLITIS
jgi:hypothetical protein